MRRHGFDHLRQGADGGTREGFVKHALLLRAFVMGHQRLDDDIDKDRQDKDTANGDRAPGRTQQLGRPAIDADADPDQADNGGGQHQDIADHGLFEGFYVLGNIEHAGLRNRLAQANRGAYKDTIGLVIHEKIPGYCVAPADYGTFFMGEV